MCRHLAYVGPPIALRTVLSDVAHGLEHQAYAPRELLSGVVCADGYGVAWQDEDNAMARYAYPGPIWSDGHLASMMGNIRSGSLMAAVRNATIAGANHTDNCAPFLDDGWSFSHNGYLENLPAWQDALGSRVPRGNTDSERIFLTFLDRLDDAKTPAQAMQELCRHLLDFGEKNGLECQLNLLASNGKLVLATRAGTRHNNSLYTLVDGDDFPGGILAASEPIVDDATWQPVEENTVVVMQEGAPLVHLRI